MKTIKYLDFEVLNQSYASARKEISSGSVLTISPNSYGLTTKNPKLDKALKESRILVLDGVYFGLGYFLRKGKSIQKNQGPDIFYTELELQNNSSGKVFFLGSSEKTLELIHNRLDREYPNISFECFSPPYVEQFSTEDIENIETAIKSFQPNVVMVGLTCPKQEIWINEQLHKYPNTLIMGIGGVFDWFAGNYKELHPIWWKLRLGWMGRIIQRPEIIKRNLPNILSYLKHMFR